METPTLETELNGQPFMVTGDEQAIMDMAEQLRRQQQREYVIDIGKRLVIAPLLAVEAVGRGFARGLGHLASEVQIDLYDHVNGTNFREQINAKRQREKDARMAGKLGLM